MGCTEPCRYNGAYNSQCHFAPASQPRGWAGDTCAAVELKLLEGEVPGAGAAEVLKDTLELLAGAAAPAGARAMCLEAAATATRQQALLGGALRLHAQRIR